MKRKLVIRKMYGNGNICRFLLLTPLIFFLPPLFEGGRGVHVSSEAWNAK